MNHFLLLFLTLNTCISTTYSMESDDVVYVRPSIPDFQKKFTPSIHTIKLNEGERCVMQCPLCKKKRRVKEYTKRGNIIQSARTSFKNHAQTHFANQDDPNIITFVKATSIYIAREKIFVRWAYQASKEDQPSGWYRFICEIKGCSFEDTGPIKSLEKSVKKHIKRKHHTYCAEQTIAALQEHRGPKPPAPLPLPKELQAETEALKRKKREPKHLPLEVKLKLKKPRLEIALSKSQSASCNEEFQHSFEESYCPSYE